MKMEMHAPPQSLFLQFPGPPHIDLPDYVRLTASCVHLHVLFQEWINVPCGVYRIVVIPTDQPALTQELLYGRINVMIKRLAQYYTKLVFGFEVYDDGFSIIFVDNPSEVQVQ